MEIPLLPSQISNHLSTFGVRIDIKPSRSFCQYSRVRSSTFYRYFFRGSTLLNGVRTKHWWRTKTSGGVYFINPSECVDINLYTLIKEIDSTNLIREFRYRLKSVMWTPPTIEIFHPSQFPSITGGQTFGSLYLYRTYKTDETAPPIINENKGQADGIKGR